jgi:hypothetical protein
MKPCQECSSSEAIFHLTSRACDSNYFQFNDLEEQRGYAPSINGLCDSDGCCMTICLDCGTIQGLNLDEAKAEILKEYKMLEQSEEDKDQSVEEEESSEIPNIGSDVRTIYTTGVVKKAVKKIKKIPNQLGAAKIGKKSTKKSTKKAIKNTIKNAAQRSTKKLVNRKTVKNTRTFKTIKATKKSTPKSVKKVGKKTIVRRRQ